MHRGRTDDVEAVDRLASGIDVPGEPQGSREAALPVDHSDSGVCHAPLGGPTYAIQLDGAAVRLVRAGDEVHEHGLASPVLADQRVDLAASDIERDVIHAADTRKYLHDPAHRQSWLPGHQFTATLCGCRAAGRQCHDRQWLRLLLATRRRRHRDSRPAPQPHPTYTPPSTATPSASSSPPCANGPTPDLSTPLPNGRRHAALDQSM
jgi:hypothetical protein